MKISFTPLLALVLCCTLLSCQQPHHSTEQNKKSADEQFNDFKDYFLEDYWRLNPTAAIYVGYHKYDSLLELPTPENRKKSIEGMMALLDSMRKIDIQQLSAANQIDYHLIEDNILGAAWYANDFRSYEWNPASYNASETFAEIINGNYDQLDNRLRSVLKRIKEVSLYYTAAKANIKNPTIIHTDLAIKQNKGGLSVFEKSLVDSLSKSGLSEEEKMQMMTGIEDAKKAMADYITWLEKEIKPALNPQTTRSFRIGKELYDKKFLYDIQSNLTAGQLFEKAKSRRDSLHQWMTALTQQLWGKYFGKQPIPEGLRAVKLMIGKLSANHVPADSFLSAIKKQIPELARFVNEKQLLYLDPNKPLVVRETPGYMQGVTGASISAPGPYDKNANTYYNVDPLSKSPQEAESWLREYNHYVLQVLNIHEAIPGHYAQLVYSNLSPSIIKSVFGNGAMIEGWAVYTELMMMENGYGNREPEMWLMYYKWHLRAVCNTILDYSVHVLNMSEEEAMKLLTDEAFQEEAEAKGKWRRVSLTQVQLCSYFSGFNDIYELREGLKKQSGEQFNLKQFHEKFLSYGSSPVKYIREMMLKDIQPKAPPQQP